MDFKQIRNDYNRNRAGHTALILFMTLASGLVVIATIVVFQLLTSLNGMYETAKPPHFLQMHKGEMDQNAIDAFNSSYEGIIAWQTVPTITVYGDNLRVYGKKEFTLSETRLDIGIVKQNKEYDLLLDHDRKVIHLEKGEIGIPVILLESYDIRIGDKVTLTNSGLSKEFVVAEFVHDAQMNSTMASSTRILISDADFDELYGTVGEIEYLIEAYFSDKAMATRYQTAYQNAGLPQDGQAVTNSIIYLLSAFRDLMMAMVFILVSLLLVLIALMCIKYTLIATLEEEITEIGTMKAIGLSFKDIREYYLQKYKVLVSIGILFGYLLALVLSSLFTSHINRTFGREPISLFSIVLPIVACGLVYALTLYYCKRILKKLKDVTVVGALVNGKGFGKKERVKDGLHRSKRLPVNLLMSLRETLHQWGSFMIVFFVMFIVSGIIIVPMNLINTMQSKEFITYMGSSMDDVLIEIDSGKHLEEKYIAIKSLLEKDQDVSSFEEIRRVRVETLNSDGEWMNLHIDLSVNSGKELQYLYGVAPMKENEIALSKLNADVIGKSVGDHMDLRFNGETVSFTITGIYQDVTSGGFTAKATHGFTGVESRKYQFTVTLKPGVDEVDKVSTWKSTLGTGYDIEPMEEFINQILGGVSKQLKITTMAIALIGILLSALIILLYLKLRLVKDRAKIAAMKAIGFTNRDVRKQYRYKMSIISLLGILLGTLISNLLGETIVGIVLSLMGLGISKITFIINPWVSFIGLPIVLLLVVLLMTGLSTRRIQEYNIISLINE